MSYKKKFEAYLDGTLDEEKAMEIEEDLERVKVISEYLEDELDDKLFEEDDEHKEEGEVEAEKKDNELTELIQRAINKKLRRYGIAMGSVVLAIVLFLMFGLSPIMNRIYYNPAKQVDYHNVIDLPLSVYTELHNAFSWFNYTNITEEGFGKYTMQVAFQDSGEIDSYYVTLNKGKFEGYYDEMLRSRLYGNSFTRGGAGCLDYEPEDEYALAELRKLPDTAIVECHLSFPEDIDLETLQKIQAEYENLHIGYVGVRAGEGNSAGAFYGFQPYGTGIVFSEKIYDSEKYPLLDLGNTKAVDKTPVEQETHFKSMLKYMIDEKNFNKAIDNTVDYKSALEYVETNGIKTYGVAARVPVKDLLELRDSGIVENVMVTDVKLSNFSK